MRRILLILVTVAVVGYGIVAILRGPARSFTASVLGSPTSTQTAQGPSFADDQDRDGLSDAKENIFGTDPKNKDTDEDGYLDGEEVSKGFDPTVPGSGKISDNPTLIANLTVQYFEWARTVAKVNDPQINDTAVQQFLNAQGLTTAPLPDVADSELTTTDDNSVAAMTAYFTGLASVQLPTATASYVDLADEVIRNHKSGILDQILGGLVSTYEAVRKIPTPPHARDVQRQQLSLLKALRNLFSDLYTIDRDPVMLVRDVAWGNDLLTKSGDLEQQRQTLLSSLPAR